MFTIRTLCRDICRGGIIGPYEDKWYGPSFATKEEAFAAAVDAAESELEDLCDETLQGVSFGIPEGTDGYQTGSEVVINYYGEDDTTEWVTSRTVVEI